MKWNAVLMIRYGLPNVGREAKAMEVFTDAFTTFGKLAAEGKCSEPEVIHHLVGGGMMFIKTEAYEDAHEILEMDHVREVIDTALFCVSDMEIEIMVTGDVLLENMAFYTKIGTDLTYI